MTGAVAIVGAGLSGLCLAQALKQAGLPFHVYEAGSGSSVFGQGYRLTITETGLAALKACLPDDLYRLALATSGASGGTFTLATPDKKILDRQEFSVPSHEDDERSPRQMDRGTLRQILMGGLTDNVSFNKRLTAIHDDRQELGLRFADGSVATACIGIGADGIHSVARDFVYPGTAPQPFGFTAIFGRCPLEVGGRPIIPDDFANSGVLVPAPRGAILFFTSMRFRERPDVVGQRLGPISLAPQDDYVMWSVIIRDGIEPLIPSTAHSGSHLLQSAQLAIKNFHPDFRRMVEVSDPEKMFLTTVRTSARPLGKHGDRMTLIGDAIHAMPPFGGQGGNTALKDAQTLARCLIDQCGDMPGAIRHYEGEMLEYGFSAVASAVAAARRMVGQ